MSKEIAQRIAFVVRDAGGRVVGRTKLQKLVYVLVQSGLEPELPYTYKHYGPYSETVAAAARDAHLLGFLREREEPASWGGVYSVYSFDGPPDNQVDPVRIELAHIAASADAVELELAATALLLAREGRNDAWAETERRKPEKAAAGKLAKAKELYGRLVAVNTPVRLPAL